MGGANNTGAGVTNTIDFITFASIGNAQDFGDYSGTWKGDSSGASN